MDLFRWEDSYSVNNDEIDKQHMKLVGMINNLAASMAEAKGREVVGNIISELVDYTNTHFRYEEGIFNRISYPESHEHKKEHLAFEQKISEFKQGFDSGKLTVTVEVLNFLCDWLREHILETDKKYGNYIIEHDIEL